MKFITSFSGNYRFLSNFWIEPDGTCVEVEYQQAKCANKEDRLLFNGLTPFEAHELGNVIELRNNWKQIRNSVMFNLVFKKFEDHKDLRQMLIETYPAELIEGNTWGDTYWGVCNGTGENHHGKILMFIRLERMISCT